MLNARSDRETGQSLSRAAGTTRIAEGLAASALVVGALTTIGSHTIFEAGHWAKAEPVAIGMYLAGFLAFAALAFLAAADSRRLTACVSGPVVLLPAAIALWSLSAAPTAAYPMAVVLGPPQSAQGTFWYLILAGLTVCARIVRGNRAVWMVVASAALAVGFSLALLRSLPEIGLTQPLLAVGGYYAYVALALPLLALPLAGRARLIFGAFGIVVAVLILVVSRNLSASVAFGLGMGIAAMLAMVPSRAVDSAASKWLAAGLVIAAAVFPYFILRSSEWLSDYPSLLSRQLTIRVAEAAGSISPTQALLGQGLGHTQDLLFRYAGASGTRFWSPEWDFIWRDYYHSHNWMMESYLTMGAAGTILTLCTYLAPVLWGDPRLRPHAAGFSSALVLLDGLWMPLSFFLPFLALAWAALAAPVAQGPFRTADDLFRRRLPTVLSFAVVGFLLLGVAGIQAWTALKTSALEAALLDVSKPPPDDPLSNPLQNSDRALAEISLNVLDVLARRAPERRDEAVRARFEWVLRELSETIPGTRTAALPMAGLSLFAMVGITKELAWVELSPSKRDRLWAAWAEKLLQLAPTRADGLIPFLSHLAAERQFGSLMGYADRILAIQPGNPVGLYFKGVAFTADPSPLRKAEGMRYISAAISAGIEQFFPVPDWLRNEAASYPLPRVLR